MSKEFVTVGKTKYTTLEALQMMEVGIEFYSSTAESCYRKITRQEGIDTDYQRKHFNSPQWMWARSIPLYDDWVKYESQSAQTSDKSDKPSGCDSAKV